MNTNNLLEQLLRSGQNLLKPKGAGDQSAGQGGLGALGGLLGGKGGAGGLGGMLSGMGGKAAAAGAISVLLGNKKLGKLASYGGLAALGMMAYKAYQNHQAQQGSTAPAPTQTIDRLAPAEQEIHSRAILVALIAAAKADGHVDEQERALIEQELNKANDDPELNQWLQNQLNQPLDAQAVAREASSPEVAAEMYLASLLLIDRSHFMERAYLDELASQLKLEPGLVQELESQANKAL